MAVPKHKVSKARHRTRSAHNFVATANSTTECPHCHAVRKQHTVCGNCGYYKGTHFVETRNEKREKKTAEKANTATGA